MRICENGKRTRKTAVLCTKLLKALVIYYLNVQMFCRFGSYIYRYKMVILGFYLEINDKIESLKLQIILSLKEYANAKCIVKLNLLERLEHKSWKVLKMLLFNIPQCYHWFFAIRSNIIFSQFANTLLKCIFLNFK